jgi:hypothetical protein
LIFFPVSRPHRFIDLRLGLRNRLDKAAIVAGGYTDITWLAGKQILDPFPIDRREAHIGSCVSLVQSRLCVIHINYYQGNSFYST